MARDAGLTDIQLERRARYVDDTADRKGSLYQKIIAHLPEGETPGDYITSLYVTARKPAAS